MSRSMSIVAAALALAVACGCGIAEGPRKKLQYSSFMFNEGLRWGRSGEVVTRIDPESRDQIMAMHSDWGSQVQISDAEIIESVVDDAEGLAQLSVRFVWYRQTEMVVHETVLVQHWRLADDGEWYVVAEEHRSGTPF